MMSPMFRAFSRFRKKSRFMCNAGFGVGLIESAGLLEEHDAEAVVTGVAQGQPVLGFVHAETARTARARGRGRRSC